MAKKTKKPARTETRYKTRQELIQETIAWMDWERVREVYKFFNWTWDKADTENGIPSVDDLKQHALELLNGAYDEAEERIKYKSNIDDSEISHSSGGLASTVSLVNGEVYDVGILFIVESNSAEAVEVLSYS